MNYNIHMTKNNHRSTAGFTLIELVVTMAVVSILLLTGIPMLNQMTASNRLVAQINSIAGSLTVARSESIKRARSITLCGSTDSTTCNTSNWESGWIVFSDANNNAVLDSATDVRLKIVNQLSGSSTLRLSRSDSASILRYRSDGSLRDIDPSVSGINNMGTFTLCDPNATSPATTAKAVNLSPLGRVSRAEDTDDPADSIANDVTGVDVTCP